MSFDPVSAISDAVMGVVKRLWPEPMSKEKEAEVANAMEDSFRNFIVQYEGSAKDYQNVPIIGPIILLARGLIRPVWTIAVMYYQHEYFVGAENEWSERKWKLLLINTVLVLIFWFGERAVKNVMPFLMQMFKKN